MLGPNLSLRSVCKRTGECNHRVVTCGGACVRGMLLRVLFLVVPGDLLPGRRGRSPLHDILPLRVLLLQLVEPAAAVSFTSAQSRVVRPIAIVSLTDVGLHALPSLLSWVHKAYLY